MNKNKIFNYMMGPVGAAILSFISLPIITWFYSIDDVGKISMLQIFSSLTILIFCLGLDQAYAREYHEAEDKGKLFKQVFLPGFILLLVSFSTIYVIDSQAISRWLYAEESSYLTIVSIVCFVLAYCSRFLSLILRMQERALAYSMSQLLPKLFFLLFILSTVWLGLTNDFYNLITAHALSIFTVFIVFSWNTRDDWVMSIAKTITRDELKPLLHFGLPLVIGGLAAWGLKVIDKFFLRSLSTFSELGIYSVAISITGVATIFSGVFNTIWAPLVYKWVSEKKVDHDKIDKISEHLLAAVYFLVVLSGLFSWVIPYVLPEEYESIQFIISICLFVPLLYTLSEVTAVGIAIAKKTKYSMYVSLIAIIINVIGNYFLIPFLGATGAAISTAISFWVFYIVRTEFSRYVWRNIPTTKAYLITLILLFSAILNAIFIKQNDMLFMIWLILAILGLGIFKSTVHLIYNKTRKYYA